MKNIGSHAKKGIMWTAFFNAIQFFIHFGSSIILARILFPEDFGLMGIAMIVVQFSRRMANFGFMMALVQRHDINEHHKNTVFTVNLALMSLITLSIVAASGLLADFFNDQRVQLILAVISFDFVLKGILAVPRALLRREMKFKQVEFARTVGQAVNLISPIGFALLGWGVWSLVWGTLLGSAINAAITIYYAGWVPKFRFNKAAFNDVFSFGIWAFIDNYLNYFILKIDYFLIGKFINASQLGLYERAFNMMNMPRDQIVKNLNNVLFPAFSRMQTEPKKVVKAFKKVVASLSFLSYPIMIWLYFAAPSLIMTLYGPKWVEMIVPLQIMCISGLFNVFSMILLPVILSHAQIMQRAIRQFIFLIFLAVSIYFSLPWGITGVSWVMAIASIFYLFLMFDLVKKTIPITLKDFFNAQVSSIIYGLIQTVLILVLIYFTKSKIEYDSWIMLLSISGVSLVSIIISHLIFRFDDVDEMFNEIKLHVKEYAEKIVGFFKK